MRAYIGCRTTAWRHARGQGISVYDIDDTGRQARFVECFEGLTNPSYLALNRRGDRLYCVHGDRSDISAFAIDADTGALILINSESTGGANPVHLALAPSERFIVVSNHISGTLAVMALTDEGALSGRSDVVELSGTLGPHRIEQPFAKPHANPFTPDGRHVVVPDKGLDCVFVFPFDAETGGMDREARLAIPAREGAGPRHIDFHPKHPVAYVVNELDSTVTTYDIDYNTGQMRGRQILPSIDARWTGNNRAAGLAVSPAGDWVVVSNRGEDSLGLYAVDPHDASLRCVEHVSAGGRTPRFLGFDNGPGHLYVVNEDSDTVNVFALVDGGLSPIIEINTPSPVCIVFHDG